VIELVVLDTEELEVLSVVAEVEDDDELEVV